mmetsp:Transcript_95681/g.254053  ORF Transcript_95681/g.254053 Transcript_95681/m.254053 type:complete len:217 (-) Transcript_95681:22-672(-)|eukprot:CAMPEP_0171200214 /NCGR_PEP_ID=MMETSP0790-20130122/23865_1 /TAXON_ID=2925 /ORGANISM="Alexandrium catenella, Strain OF101" /LENGTH=216 /DNA_ID=CAMNT_0011665587 /DNA_START=70 /DNA_END=720 /DNA_ORIENTATION=+
MPATGMGSDAVIQAWVTGATNFPMVLVAVQAYRYGLYYECVMGLMTMITSTAYHVCQSLDWKLLGFNEGRWHHMDNVFAIASLMAIILGFAQLPKGSAAREMLNTSSVSLAVVAQLMSPWDLNFTVGPLVASAIAFLLSVLARRRLPHLDGRSGRLALAFLFGAAVCFAKGLDQRKDWLRLWHGGWHLFVSGFCLFALRSQHPQRLAKGVTPTKDA